MAHYELADGVFIEYTLSDLGGTLHCSEAKFDCTFESKDQADAFIDLIDTLGLDDNTSLIMHINENVCEIPGDDQELPEGWHRAA